jgi:hypothetical protein
METLFNLEEYELGQAETLVMSRLNQWVDEEAKVPWQREPRLDTLPPQFANLRGVKGVADKTFLYEHDFAFLREAVWMHRIADQVRAQKSHGGSEAKDGNQIAGDSPLKFVSADDPEDLRLAMRLFDWTIRNVQLEKEDWPKSGPYGLDVNWHTPYETVLLGRGTASDRAWTFILLARQQGLRVVMLGLGDAAKPGELKPWIPALVLANGEGENKRVDLYLFDPAFGLPIPTADGKGIATLAEAAADDAVLRRFDLSEDQKYPVTQEDLAEVTALVEASPGYLSRRMALLESRLGGDQRMVLTASVEAIEKELAGTEHVRPKVSLWMRPYETFHVRESAPDLTLDAARAELFPLQGLLRPIGSLATDRKASSRGEDVSEWANPDQKGPARNRLRVPLGVGRMLMLAGDYGHEEGALRYLLQAMATNDDQSEIVRVLTEDLQSKMPSPGDPATQQQIARIVESRVSEFRRADQAAKVWVGQIKAREGEFDTAIKYFTSWDTPDWQPAISYSLGRVYEAQQKPKEAIDVYRQDDSAQRPGNLLRGRWLEKVAME